MKTDTRVSIITICRNGEAVLKKTIESVLGQTYDNIEYIIIDGASSDRSVALAESYKGAFEERRYLFKVISEADQGIYDAMNKGISLATGELVGLINSGDWYERQAVQRMIDTYEKTGFDLFYADLRIIKRTGPMIKKARLTNHITTKDWNHPTTFIRRKVYRKYQYACRGICDDLDLIMRIQNAGYKVAVLNEVLANFCFGGVSSQRSIVNMKMRVREKYRVYRENGYSRLYLIECFLVELVKYILG